MAMEKLKVKTETTAARCEVCHQADLFDPITEKCSRCDTVVKAISDPKPLTKQAPIPSFLRTLSLEQEREALEANSIPGKLLYNLKKLSRKITTSLAPDPGSLQVEEENRIGKAVFFDKRNYENNLLTTAILLGTGKKAQKVGVSFDDIAGFCALLLLSIFYWYNPASITTGFFYTIFFVLWFWGRLLSKPFTIPSQLLHMPKLLKAKNKSNAKARVDGKVLSIKTVLHSDAESLYEVEFEIFLPEGRLVTKEIISSSLAKGAWFNKGADLKFLFVSREEYFLL
jgi:hypothetical protein